MATPAGNAEAVEARPRPGGSSRLQPVFVRPSPPWAELVPAAEGPELQARAPGVMRYLSAPVAPVGEPSPCFSPKSRYYLSSFHVHALPAAEPERAAPELLDAILAELGPLRAKLWRAAPASDPPKLLRASAPERLTIPTLTERGALVFATAAWVAPRFDSPAPAAGADLVEAGHPLEHDLIVLSFSQGAWGRYLVFGVGTRFADRQGATHDHAAALEPELLTLLGTLRLLPPR